MPHASPLEADLAQALAVRLRELRETAGLTQERVALDADISRDYYGRLESAISHRGHRTPANPTLAVLVALSRVLGTTVPDLVGEVFDRRAGAPAQPSSS